jgi:hypothetical protein
LSFGIDVIQSFRLSLIIKSFMCRLSFFPSGLLLKGCLLVVLLTQGVVADDRVQFNQDIRPILSNHCFPCHGPDENNRESGLRLDKRETALKLADSGKAAIVPGHPAESELIQRVFAEDSAVVMPPEDHSRKLTLAEKGLLRRWVTEGGAYEQHWSLMALRRPPIPEVKDCSWIRNAVDSFVLTRLEAEGLRPSAKADWTTIFRRLSLDLTGLPPIPEDLASFRGEMAAAESEDAKTQGEAQDQSQDGRSSADRVYGQWVDKLLASPHYGERMAVDWLDAARFADTNGYQVDRDREMYAWRDWVINAFNSNQPFDQFTIEQLAGDLLPSATLEQRIATGFQRNHMMNEEGGILPEEFLAEYCADRVETMATVWLGQTFSCCRCHDHKYDPYTQKDYYSLVAFFHNITEKGVGDYGANIRRNAPPILKLPAPELETKLASLKEQLAEIEKLFAERDTSLAEEEARRVRDPDCRTLAEQIETLKQQIDKTDLEIPTTLVMEEMSTPRPTFILIRGAYNQKGAKVTAATPAALPDMSAKLPRNRLGLARWLVDPTNPLTARVTVNRFWQSLFGTGIVRTAEDFGIQGELPTHPELLDWLASEFVRTSWDIKALMRLLVTSSTYRQASRQTAELRERDPQNRLLARGPRFRLQAEFLRDQALAASGLLVTKIGGPSVRPYHPPGLYEQVVSGSSAKTYVLGKGDELYRRSLYTYWKRSVPNPAMLVFDAPFRETCTMRRSRTNTPLQALNLMNDPTYVEAARLLAQRMIREGGKSISTRITRGYQLLLGRVPSAEELLILAAAYERTHGEYRRDRDSAAELIAVGESNVDDSIDVTELAAMTTIASTLLNLDEAVMKE